LPRGRAPPAGGFAALVDEAGGRLRAAKSAGSAGAVSRGGDAAERILAFPAGRVSGRISRWANRHPSLYELRFAWIWPAWFLIFRLRAVKALAPIPPESR
jgi:hypothetical protein